MKLFQFAKEIRHYLNDYFASLLWWKRLVVAAFLFLAGACLIIHEEIPLIWRVLALIGLLVYATVTLAVIGMYQIHPSRCLGLPTGELDNQVADEFLTVQTNDAVQAHEVQPPITAAMTSYTDAGQLEIVVVYENESTHRLVEGDPDFFPTVRTLAEHDAILRLWLQAHSEEEGKR